MDRFIGVWWSGAEPDVIPAGKAAAGYKAASFNGVGQDYPVIRDILKYVYARGVGHATRDRVGEVLYNRGVVNAAYDLEAIATAQGRFGKKSLTGEEVRWGYEHLSIGPDRVARLGAAGLMIPIRLSCADHEGSGEARIQQWDGNRWAPISDWIEPPDHAMIAEMYKTSALNYAREKKIAPRDCAKLAQNR
jgi:branched-chain amino acid transport system substrate-binding protein